MIAIITGDVINSEKSNPKKWLKYLKGELNKYGKSPSHWEIYRGDSFQLELKLEDSLRVAILIKATIMQIEPLDVRMAIGIGEKEHAARKITESNGSAFVNSGRCFEALKKNTLAIKSPWEDFDIPMNIMLELALLTMNHWTPTSAEAIKLALENPDKNQSDLAKILGKIQSNVSGSLNRGGYFKILKMIDYYQMQIAERC